MQRLQFFWSRLVEIRGLMTILVFRGAFLKVGSSYSGLDHVLLILGIFVEAAQVINLRYSSQCCSIFIWIVFTCRRLLEVIGSVLSIRGSRLCGFRGYPDGSKCCDHVNYIPEGFRLVYACCVNFLCLRLLDGVLVMRYRFCNVKPLSMISHQLRHIHSVLIAIMSWVSRPGYLKATASAANLSKDLTLGWSDV